MADNIYAGLFTSPDQIRQKRLDDLRKQQMMVSGSGGSWDQLLGQVAASGNLMANQLTEGVAGMFGMQTKEEAKAQAVQDLAKSINWDNPEDLTSFAKQLNDMGMTEQAVKVLDIRRKNMADAEAAGKRNVYKKVIKYMQDPSDPYGRPIPYETSIQVTQVKDDKGNWVDLDEQGKPVTPNTPEADPNSAEAARRKKWEEMSKGKGAGTSATKPTPSNAPTGYEGRGAVSTPLDAVPADIQDQLYKNRNLTPWG